MFTSSPKRPFSVLIPDGESEFALFALHCLARYPEVKVYVLSGKRWASIRFSRHAFNFTFKQMGQDDESRFNAVEEIVRKYKIDVLLPTDTDWISFAISNREALSHLVMVAPVPDPKAFEIANDKWLLAEFLRINKIPGPPTLLVSSSSAFEHQLEMMEFPVLLKPALGRGGEGIQRFDSLANLKSYLDQPNSKRKESKYIVQTLLSGSTLGLDYLSHNGLLQAATLHAGFIPNTKEYAAAGATRFFKDDRFVSEIENLIRALKWNGFANVDALYDSRDGQLKILEINARFWGSLRGALVAGVSYPYLACLAALNIPFEMPVYRDAKYFHTATALREWLSRYRGKARSEKFAWHESGVHFLLNDPIAEGLRALRQFTAPEGSNTV